MEEEFIRNQERLKPQEEKIEVMYFDCPNTGYWHMVICYMTLWLVKLN
jgi:hypothetical protein